MEVATLMIICLKKLFDWLRKMYISNLRKVVNFKIFNMIAGITELKTLKDTNDNCLYECKKTNIRLCLLSCRKCFCLMNVLKHFVRNVAICENGCTL